MTSPEPEVTGPEPEVPLNRKSRGLNGKTTDQSKKSIVGSGWGNTAEEGRLKVQSPIGTAGKVLHSKQHKNMP